MLQQEERVTEILSGLYETGVAAGGVVIMDVGINPAHVVHRAAMRLAEGIAIVIKPEIPDLAETRRWITRMIGSMASDVGREAAFEYIGSRVKLCYRVGLRQPGYGRWIQGCSPDAARRVVRRQDGTGAHSQRRHSHR